eukprot:9739251-Ditylum_brightwellii.AAC.2
MDIAGLGPATDANHRPAFYKRVQSNIISTAIKNNLTVDYGGDCCLKRSNLLGERAMTLKLLKEPH